ncbi:hypothetical protein CcCBS67573_g09742, partial [Chytriomyces confervae]
MAAGMLVKTLMPKNKDSSHHDSDAGGNGLVGTLMGAAAGGPAGLIGGIGSKWKEMSSFQRFEALVAIAGVAYLGIRGHACTTSDEARVIYKHSQGSVVTYNHLMDELEYLNHQVLHGKRNKGGLLYGKPISEDLYIAAIRLFRLELFNELCLINPLVSMFGKSIIPTLDQHPTSAHPVELFGERAKKGSGKRKVGRKPTDIVPSGMFNHVHTLFLVDDSGSMALNGSANWSDLTDPNFGSIHVEKSVASSQKSGVMGFASGLMAKTGNFFGPHSEVFSTSRSVAHESIQPPDSKRDFRYQPEDDSKAMRPLFCKLCAFDNRNDFSGGPKSRGIFSPTGGRETAVALTGSSRWVHVRSLLSHMTQTIAQHDPRGVDLLFLNNHSVHSGIRHGEWIQAVFDNVAPPTGGTPTGRTMHEILDAYISTLRYDSTFKALNIDILAIKLGIEFIQVGDDEIATAQLDLLEEYVDSHRGSTQKDV